jgi:translation initiation factor IF-2
MGKVRIYDLAKELKLESKKILEDARRMGVDVSVASNTLDDAIAAKIREMYYPKKKEATAPSRTARLIKHAPGETSAAGTAPAPVDSNAPGLEPISEPAPAALPPVAPASQTPTVKTLTPPPKPTQAPAQVTTPAPAPPKVVAPAPPATPSIQAEQKSRVTKLAPPSTPVAPARVELESPAMEPVAEQAPAPVQVETKPVEAPAEPQAPVPVAPPHATPAPALDEQTTIPLPLPRPAQPARAAPQNPPPAARGTTGPLPKPPVTPGGLSSKAPGTSPGTAPGGTKVIKLAPRGPMPRPAPPPRSQPISQGKPGVAVGEAKPGQQRGEGKDVHILPSGAQQRTVYIPPQDKRPKGRNQQRGKEKEKFQEGNTQKLAPRRTSAIAAAPAMRQAPAELKPVRLVEGSTVREFAEKIDAKPRDIVTALMQRGVMATINQTITHEMATEIGREYGWDVSFGEFEDMIIESEFEITPEAMEDTDPRAPVVTVMGHVDHGKTSLLDAIRSARVAEGEAGGITQHIGAYSVEVPNPDAPGKDRRVVFLDTPGHEAFTMMRARGARVTDIVVLVVAADDGVMPQTVEAIEHAKAAKVPIVVAINKIDKPDANPDRVRKELADRGLRWSNWGGDIEMVEVSAKKRQNIDGLLEMILLTADILELKSNPKRMATGTVLEAKLDRGRGSVATVLIQNGTLRIGEPFIVGNYFGKVRALVDDRGDRILESGPATPVEVLGLEGVPAAGDQFQVVDDVSKAQQISQLRLSKARITQLSRSAARGLDQLALQLETGEVKELLVILKADVQGSVEVLKDTLVKLSTDKVKVRIIRAGVGAITYDDVLLASASNATETGAATVIIGFNVRPESRADDIAKQEDVDIRLHSIIYKVEEEIRNAMLGLMEATLKDVVLGKAEVRDVIRVPKVGSVAGSMVLNGSIKRTAQARLIRDNVVIFETSIGSLRRFKDDVSEVQQGYECGITLDRFNDYKVGDVIEAYIVEKVAPTKL